MVGSGCFRTRSGSCWSLPKTEGRVGRNFANNRRVVEGMLRTGLPWRDLPQVFGSWQTV
ncbi:transposase [Nocardia terpenica]|uniref:transposase n=1 Tax=Nocardia terpenica TaxID=455432 RepID=UPI003D161BD0